jgi:SLT domain-containing protein
MAMNMTAAVNIKASVDGLAQVQGLEKALNKADKQASGLSASFSKLGAMAGKASQAMLALGAAAIGGVAVFGKQAIDAADNINDLSQRTGVGVEALSKFGAAAEDSGSSLEEIGKAMGRLARGIADSSSATSEALQSIGVSTVDSTGKLRGVDAVMLDIADKFSKLPEGAEKTALAMEIFGKAGANLIPMLNGGSAAISEYSATITTEMAQAADAFNDAINAIMRELAGPFNEAVTAALPYITQLAQQLGEFLPVAIQSLIPVLQGMLQVLAQIGQWFTSLSPEVQTFVVVTAALTAAFIALAPAITALISVATALGPIIASVAAAIAAAPAVIAGFVGALAPLGAALLTLGKILIGVFTGPVGWVALAVAAGVAIYAFRDKIAAAFGVIGKILADAAGAFKRTFVDPVVKLAGDVVKGIANAFRGLADALRSPFDAVTRFIRNIFNGYLSLVEKFINSAVNGINKLISAANRALAALKLPNIPLAPTVTIPRFAQGGTVDRPTLAMVGEGGQREYIIPESKMARASANYLMGARGAGVVPGAASSASQGNTTVQITTGPVLQQGGQRYVTIEDLERSLNSLAANLLGNNRSFAGRRFQGAI